MTPIIRRLPGESVRVWYERCYKREMAENDRCYIAQSIARDEGRHGRAIFFQYEAARHYMNACMYRRMITSAPSEYGKFATGIKKYPLSVTERNELLEIVHELTFERKVNAIDFARNLNKIDRLTND